MGNDVILIGLPPNARIDVVEETIQEAKKIKEKNEP